VAKTHPGCETKRYTFVNWCLKVDEIVGERSFNGHSVLRFKTKSNTYHTRREKGIQKNLGKVNFTNLPGTWEASTGYAEIGSDMRVLSWS